MFVRVRGKEAGAQPAPGQKTPTHTPCRAGRCVCQRTVCDRARSVLFPGSNGLTTWVKEISCSRRGGGAACAHRVNQCGVRAGLRPASRGTGIWTTRRSASRRVQLPQQAGGCGPRSASASRDSMNDRRTSSDQVPSGAVVGARGCFFGLAFIDRVKARESWAWGGRGWCGGPTGSVCR